MDVVNVEEYNHSVTMEQDKLLELVTSLNVKNKRYIDSFRKNYKKVHKASRPPPTPQTEHRNEMISTA